MALFPNTQLRQRLEDSVQRLCNRGLSLSLMWVLITLPAPAWCQWQINTKHWSVLGGTVEFDTNPFWFKILFTVEKVSAFCQNYETPCWLEETLEDLATGFILPKPPENWKHFPGPFPSILLNVNPIPSACISLSYCLFLMSMLLEKDFWGFCTTPAEPTWRSTFIPLAIRQAHCLD